ncbi:MAG TPA: type II secretion system protein [Patescibacteria group bacterium]|nr:type II secretion system protein [Patescibacteria group bacterium]
MTTAKKTFKKLQKGFTLIELLIVIGILAVLMGIVLVAINPAKQFAQANNTKRQADVNTILNAISQYQADHKGALPIDAQNNTIDSNTREIKSNDGAGTNTTGIDLCSILAPTYVASLPTDPASSVGGAQVANCSSYDTGYTVVATNVSNSNRVTVTAPLAVGESISVTR